MLLLIYGLRQILMNIVFFVRISFYLKNYYNSVFDVFSYIYLVKHKLIWLHKLVMPLLFAVWRHHSCTHCTLWIDILTIENSLLEKRVSLIGTWLVPTIKEKRWHCIRFQQLVSSNVLLPHILLKMHLNNLRVRHYKRTEIITVFQ